VSGGSAASVCWSVLLLLLLLLLLLFPLSWSSEAVRCSVRPGQHLPLLLLVVMVAVVVEDASVQLLQG
jgi:hypothetical protein